MPIYAPGVRDRHNRTKKRGKRSIVAMLSLTAMVDMFTVLAVFLLQNYQTTGEAIELSDEVKLPRASQTKELKPAHVVMVSPKAVVLDKQVVADIELIKAQKDWEIPSLAQALAERFKQAEENQKLLGLEKVRAAIDQNKPESQREKPEDLRRITVQADKSIDFLTIKKVMYTLYEAGATEINFAVLKNESGSGTK
jgi:biopolymer transport protein ExbD